MKQKVSSIVTTTFFFAIAFFLVACGGIGSKTFTREGVITDYVFSADARGSGTAYAVWWRNDSIALYCFMNDDMYKGIKAMIKTYPGVPALGIYHGDGVPVSNSPCYGIENSNVASQTFELDDVSFMICDKWFGWKPEEQKKAEEYARIRNWPACNVAIER